MRNQRGFTLVEIMIVLVILGGLMAVLIPGLIERQKNANFKLTKLAITQAINQLEMFRSDCQFYPSSEQGLSALIEDPGESCPDWGPSPYLAKVPRDGYGKELYYEYDEAEGPLVYSLGSDNREGGSGADKDYSSEDI